MKLARKLALLALLAAPPTTAATLLVEADRDATLIEDPAGLLANGGGADLFAGRTSQPTGSRRRAALHFDLEALPRQAEIESVRLLLYVSQATPRPATLTAHRLQAEWGEGASVSMGGAGVPPLPGDATWVHRLYTPAPPLPPAGPGSADRIWQRPGGDFDPAPSASAAAPGVGPVVLAGDGLLADVSGWQRQPRGNFGWILLGDEAQGGTARRLGSREGMFPDRRPRLEIVYRRR